MRSAPARRRSGRGTAGPGRRSFQAEHLVDLDGLFLALHLHFAERPRLHVLLDVPVGAPADEDLHGLDRKSTRLNSSHGYISYAVFCLKKKKKREKTYNRMKI